jgi:hypothetical protein
MIAELIYIDPGSGSYLVQAIIAAVLGAGFWIKMSWLRIKDFFAGKPTQPAEKKEDNNNS